MVAKVLKKLLFSQNLNRNNYAKELRTPLYKQRVIKSKKIYNRKDKNYEFES